MLQSLNNRPYLAKPLPFLQRKFCILDLLKASEHVNLPDVPRPLVMSRPNAVSTIYRKENWNADVRCQESIDGPILGEEHSESVDQA